MPRFKETEEIHTGLLRLGLAVDDSRAYWRNCRSDLSRKEQTQAAFEERWFGAKSFKRVDYLVFSLDMRFQGGLKDLKVWDPVDEQDRRWVCHFHLQFSDPLYRRFTDDYLPRRLERSEPTVERLSALEWLQRIAPDRWGAATAERLVSGLTSSLSDAGFCRGRTSPRPIQVPPISDEALAYLLYLLKDTVFAETLLNNPYVRGTFLGPDLHYRLKKLPAFTYHKQGSVSSLEWRHETFEDWLSKR